MSRKQNRKYLQDTLFLINGVGINKLIKIQLWNIIYIIQRTRHR